MKISARNILKGKVTEIVKGATTSHVRIDIGGGAIVTASITNEAADELNLKAGDTAYAILNFQAEYAFTKEFITAVGVTNLLDQNYSLADGFPEPGRQFYATARAKF